MKNRRAQYLNNKKHKRKQAKKTETESIVKRCIICQNEKVKTEFSNSQFKKDYGKCKMCMENPRPQQPQVQIPTDIKQLAPISETQLNGVEPSVMKDQQLLPDSGGYQNTININGLIAE